MKVKAKESFMKLTITNSYQGLHSNDFFALQEGKTITLSRIPEICKEHLQVIKKRK